MGKFTVTMTTPVFADFAPALVDALRQLGHEVVDFGQGGRVILFAGAMSIPSLPPDAIVFNSEQVASFGIEKAFPIVDAVRRGNHVVWDYSKKNVETLRAEGINAVHCPIGYIPSMTKIEHAKEEDIDVLFYGSLNERRKKILDELKAAGLKVVWLFNVYNKERDEHIARSKIVLNPHYYDNPIFEIFRVSHLLANRKCVVSEDGGIDEELEDFARSATEHVPYAQIVNTCVRLLRKSEWGDESRDVRAAHGFLRFAQTNLIDNVRKALAQS